MNTRFVFAALLVLMLVGVAGATITPVASFTTDGSTIFGITSPTVSFADTSTNSPTTWNWSFGDGTYSVSQNPSHVFPSAGNYTVSLSATNDYGTGSTSSTIRVITNQNPAVKLALTGNGTAGATTFPDVSTGKTVTSSGVIVNTSTVKYGSGSAYFNGANSYLSVPDSSDWNFATGDWSVGFWLYPGSQTSVVGSPYITYWYKDASNRVGIYEDVGGSDAGSNIGVYGVQSGVDKVYLSTVSSLPKNAWSYVVVSKSGTGSNPISIYINGTKSMLTTTTDLGASSFPYTSGETLYVGVNSTAGGCLRGNIDDLTIYKGVAINGSVVPPRELVPAAASSPPTASFTANVTSGYANLPVAFTDTSTGTPTSWQWNWTALNGTIVTFSTSQNPTQTFNAGNYSISLNATNAYGSGVSAQVTWINVTNLSGPVASFTANATSGYANLPVKFTDTSTGSPTSWVWNFTAISNSTLVTFSTSQSPAWTFNVGNFSVVLNATSVYGSTMSAATWINVSAPIPVASFTSGTNPSIAGDSVSFTDTSTNSPTKWDWYFGDSTANVTTQNPAHVFTAAGNYTVWLNASNGYGYSQVQKFQQVNNATGLNIQDIVLTGVYTLTVTVEDADTSLPIPGAAVSDTTGQNVTTDAAGKAALTEPAGVAAGALYATGYVSRAWSIVVDNDTWVTYQMTPSTANPSQNVWWTPHTVQITVMSDSYGVRLPGVMVNATYNQSSMPTQWLAQLYGIQSSPAGDMVNATIILGGRTGSDGTMTTTMLGSLKYDIVLNSATYGIVNYPVSAYPSDAMLNIYVPVVGSTLPTSGNNTYSQLNASRAYIVQPNISYLSECLDYQDTSGLTSSVTETWWFGNNDSIIKTVTFSPGTSLVTNCYTSLNVKGTRIYWVANATRSP